MAILIPLIFNLLFINSSYAVDYCTRYATNTALQCYTPSNPPPAGITADVLLIHSDGTSTSYKASANTDTARGTALVNAAAASVAGDQMNLTCNTFNIGTNLINASNFGIAGCGKYSTVIKSSYVTGSATSSVISVGSNHTYSDFTISCTDNSNFCLPIGNYGSVVTNVNFKNLYVSGYTDGVYFSHGDGSSANFYNVDINSQWDSFYLDDLGNFNFYDCTFTSLANISVNSGHKTHGILNNGGGNINLINPIIIAENGTIDNYGVLVVPGSGNLYIYGGSITTSTATQYDLSGYTIYVDGSVGYDITKVSGSLNYIDGLGNKATSNLLLWDG